MSYRVGVLAKKNTKITEIISIIVFLGLTLLFMMSKKIDVNITNEPKDLIKDFEFEDIPPIPTEPDKPIKPVRAYIPIPPDDEDDEDLFEDDEELFVEENFYDENIKAPLPPDFEEPDPVEYYDLAEKPYLSKSQKLIFSSFLKNNYPKMARRAGVSGNVTLKFICSKTGIPMNIRILSEKPVGMEFGSVAIEALQSIRFNPGIQRDRAVSVSMVWPVRFKVRK